jgi:anti-anti-sigma regulatory factor
VGWKLVNDLLKPGDHVCLLYDTMDDHLAAVARYATTGFGSDQQVVYFADGATSLEAVARSLRHNGVAVADGHAIGLCCYPYQGDTPRRVGTAHPGTVYASMIDESWTPQLRVSRDPARLTIAGEMDLSNRDSLPPVLERLRSVSDPHAPLRVDMSAVTFADVAASHLLVTTAQEWPAGLTISGCPELVIRTLRLLDESAGGITFTDDAATP